MLVSSQHLVSAQNVQKMIQFKQFHSRRKMFPAIMKKMNCRRTIVGPRSHLCKCTFGASDSIGSIQRVQLQWRIK